MARRVRRFTVNPNTCIRKTPPTRDNGIATTGISTERNEPMKRKMTTMTMISVSPRVLSTSRMAFEM